MPRTINLDREHTEDDAPLREGEWVHTTEPIIVPWFGERMRWDERLGEMRLVTTNSHQVEGKFMPWGRNRAWIETTLTPKHHDLKRHANNRVEREGIPVYAKDVPLDIIKRGPLVLCHRPRRKIKA